MATKIIDPYVYRGKALTRSAAAVLYVVWQYTQSTLGNPNKYWQLEHYLTSDSNPPSRTNLEFLLLKNVSTDPTTNIAESYIMMRRLDHLIGSTRHPTVACSFHPFGTDFGDATAGWKIPTGWLTSPATIRNVARVTNFGTNAEWSIIPDSDFSASSPECYITGGVTTVDDYYLNNLYGMRGAPDPNSGNIDIIETQDSLTVATYCNIARNGFNAILLPNVAWQHVMHAGDILTPDNRSDPNFKEYTNENMTGEGIMCGWFGHASPAQFIMPTINSTTAFPHSYARTGKVVNQNVSPDDHEWRHLTACIGRNLAYSTPPNDTSWQYAAPNTNNYLPQFGFVGDDDEREERLIPYRLSTRGPGTSFNGVSLLTRFIKQRWRGIGQNEIDNITQINYGSYANSRYADSDVSWVHQCSDNITNSAQVTPPYGTRNNTVHVWRGEGEIFDLDTP